MASSSAAYPSRPPYPHAVIQQLAALVVDEPRHVLDIGCGTGDLARRLAPLVDGVDAVDFSTTMLEAGAGLPGGGAANLRWIEGAVEDVPLAGPYALVTAGVSLHWMAWDVVLPRLAAVLTCHGTLAVAERDWDGPPALRSRLGPIFASHSPVRNYQPFDLAERAGGARALRRAWLVDL